MIQAFVRVFLVTLLLNTAVSAAVFVNDGTMKINLVPESRYFIERDITYTPETILEVLDAFEPSHQSIFNFGFMERPLWVHFDINVSAAVSEPLVLQIDNPHLDHFRLYRIDAQALTLLAEGGDRYDQKNVPGFRTYWAPLVQNAQKTGYLLYLHTDGAMQAPLLIETLREAYRGESFSNLLFGIYYGVLLLLLVYNLVLYIVVREIHYFNYLAFLGSYMLFQLIFDGIGKEWLWHGNTWMANSALPFFIFLSGMFAFRFARFFLMLKRFVPRVEILFRFSELVSLLGVLLSLVAPYHMAITVAAIWSSMIPLLLIYGGIMALPHYRPARYYLVGWFVLLLATIHVALSKLGLIPTFPAMLYTQQAGSLIQMVLLSFALADRINMMKIEHLKKLRDFNEKLQVKIAAKIDEIRRKDELMIQQSRMAAMGEMIENIAHQWRQPLNQLSLIQSNLFFEYQLGTLDQKQIYAQQEQAEALMEYMTHTIDDFRNFFLPDREKTHFSICSSIQKSLDLLKSTLERYRIAVQFECTEHPVVYGHENEFSQVMINIINNAKDAMVERATASPVIVIEVEHSSEHTRVLIGDNGGGIAPAIQSKIFDPYFTTKFQSQGTGIGLYMVKTIMNKSMNGSIDVTNRDKGACFILTLPFDETKEDDAH